MDSARASIFGFEGLIPVIDPAAFVHPSATLIGDVIISARCFVGPGAVLRGDLGRLIMHAGSNVQDTCVLHSYPGYDVVIEEDGHVGHGAVLHGCRIGRNAMVGINAVVLDQAEIGAESWWRPAPWCRPASKYRRARWSLASRPKYCARSTTPISPASHMAPKSIRTSPPARSARWSASSRCWLPNPTGGGCRRRLADLPARTPISPNSKQDIPLGGSEY